MAAPRRLNETARINLGCLPPSVACSEFSRPPRFPIQSEVGSLRIGGFTVIEVGPRHIAANTERLSVRYGMRSRKLWVEKTFAPAANAESFCSRTNGPLRVPSSRILYTLQPVLYQAHITTICTPHHVECIANEGYRTHHPVDGHIGQHAKRR